jgi:PKD repeat protein
LTQGRIPLIIAILLLPSRWIQALFHSLHLTALGEQAIPGISVTTIVHSPAFAGTYQFDSVGEYQVKHVVSSAIYGCRDSAIQTIYVARTRKCLFLDFTWTADTFYTNRLVFNPGFSKRHESGTIAMSIKEWNWGDGKPIENNTIHEFDKPGLYTVCMTAQNYYTGCISSNCKAVPVFMDTTCKADFLVSFSNYSNETTFIGKPAVRTNGVRNSWAIDNRPIVHTGNASVFQTEFHQLRRGEGRYFDYIGYDCSNGTSKEISLDSLERTITRIVYDSIKGCSDTFTRTIAIPRQKNVFIKVTRLPSSPLSLRFSAYEVRYPGDTAEFPHSGRWRIDRPGGTTFIGSYSSSYPQDWTFPYAGNFSVSISVNPCDWLAQREVYVLHFTLPVLTNRWTGRVSKAWEDPHNWILGVVPDDATDVIIEKGVVEVNAAARCRTLINRTGANIKVKNGGSLVVLQ